MREHFEAARALYASTGQPLGQAMMVCELASSDFSEGNVTDAVRRTQEALAIVPEGPGDDEHQATLAHIESRLARFLYFSGDYDAALPHADRALQIAENADLPDVLSPALDTKGSVLAARGRRTEAEVLIRGALAVALEHDLTERAAMACLSLATTLEEIDKPEPALEVYAQAAGLLQRLGDRPNAAGARLNRLLGLQELGRWAEAERMFAEYLDNDAEELSSRLWPGAQAVSAVWLYAARGDVATVRRLLDASAALVEHAHLEVRAGHDAARALLANVEGDHALALTTAEATLRACIEELFPVWMRLALIEAVEAAFSLGDTAKVVELIALVREHFRPGRQPSMDAHILRWEARIASERGDDDAAAAKFRAAVDGFATLQRPFWLAVSRLQLAEWLLAKGHDADAQEPMRQARATFEELGATSWLHRAMRGAVTTMDSTAMPA